MTALAHPCACGISASLHVIVSIEDPKVIEQILKHLKQKAAKTDAAKQLRDDLFWSALRNVSHQLNLMVRPVEL